MMAKPRKIKSHHKAATMGMLLSTGGSLAVGYWLARRVEGLVLGVDNRAWSGSGSIFDFGLVMTVFHNYGWLVFILLMAIGAYFIYQFVWMIKQLGRDHKFGLAGILRILLMDLVIVLLTVFGLAGASRYLSWRDQPQELRYERLTPELLRISWQTRRPVMSEVLWGVNPQGLDTVALGEGGEKETTEHEVLVDVVAGRPVYFKIVSGAGIRYGQDGSATPFVVLESGNEYQLEELELKEVELEN